MSLQGTKKSLWSDFLLFIGLASITLRKKDTRGNYLELITPKEWISIKSDAGKMR